jgi:uncharacterized protein YwqG
MGKTLEELSREAISIRLSAESGGPLAVGSSKIGGCPDVTSDFVWPRDDSGRPLTLLLQIKCSEVATLDKGRVLPPSGVLLFFYELGEMDWEGSKGSVRLMYIGADEALQRVDYPSDLEEKYRIEGRALCFSSRVSYPSYEDYITLCGDGEDVDYDALEREYETAKARIGDAVGRQEGEIGTMLGYADVLQNYMVEDLESNVMLMQLFSFDEAGVKLSFGDEGCIYVYADRASLGKGEAMLTKFEMQCY